MAAADLEAGLLAYLGDQADLVALCPSGLHGGELNEDETPAMPRGALVIKSSGGAPLNSESFVETSTRRIDLFAFGATPREAGRIISTAELAMKRLRQSVHGGVLLYWANAASGQSAGREPVVEWPRAFQSFQVKHAMEAAT